MADSEQIIRLYVKQQQRKGTPDAKIILGITKLSGQAGKDVNKMVTALREAGLSPSESLADYFGLKTSKVDLSTKRPVNKNPSIGQKAKSYAASAAMGLSDAGAGIGQGMAKVADGINKGVNSAFGTNYKTTAYDDYNKQYKSANANADNIRSDAGRSGGDWVRGGTEIAATVPMFLAGGGAGAGLKSGAAFAGRQAAIGAGVGASRYADNAQERAGNTAGGAIGGAVGGLIGEKVAAPVIGKAVRAVARRTANKTGSTAAAATKLVDDTITQANMPVSPAVRTDMIVEATRNLSKGKQVDAAALARESLLKRYDIQGTQAQISRDPIQWKNEVELAKNNPQLNSIRDQQHDQVRSIWQDVADDTGALPVDNNTRMDSIFNTLRQGDEAAQRNISAKYDAARELSGNDAQLNHLRFINETTAELEHEMLGSFVKGDTMNALKGLFERPDYKFTLAESEKLIKIINNRLKTTSDGSERAALSIVRKNLDNEVDVSISELSGSLGNGASDGGLAGAQGAWQEARGAARQRFQDIDSNPALKAALDDVAPDKSFNKLVLNSNERDLVRLVDDLRKRPEGQQNIADLQAATIEHFIEKAVPTGTNKTFSPAALNRAINDFGNNRMRALFTPEQIARINDIKQVSDILLQQPRSSAVNHSHSSSAFVVALQNIVGFVGKTPKIGNLAQGAANMAMKKVGDVNSAGAAAKVMNGKAGVTKGSSLGLTDEQLRMLGMIPRRTGAAGAAMGAGSMD